MGPGEQLREGSTGAPGRGAATGRRDAAGLGRCRVNACEARMLPQGNSFCPHPFSVPWLAETMPGGPSNDEQAKNGGLVISGLGVSPLS